ncbi:hypothetical protein HYFRA_00003809 [Hymenoscyphus fraxineus]|uniref:Uncharacterized protein n=1 Tax=Hymenoscyphus fraxineus TaxID=746836 RepID=A0A9N9KYN8_9HELO|nr:hypothetical protein HYFRA_00003809 [Hymenoscyphus fraxineus]
MASPSLASYAASSSRNVTKRFPFVVDVAQESRCIPEDWFYNPAPLTQTKPKGATSFSDTVDNESTWNTSPACQNNDSRLPSTAAEPETDLSKQPSIDASMMSQVANLVHLQLNQVLSCLSKIDRGHWKMGAPLVASLSQKSSALVPWPLQEEMLLSVTSAKIQRMLRTWRQGLRMQPDRIWQYHPAHCSNIHRWLGDTGETNGLKSPPPVRLLGSGVQWGQNQSEPEGIKLFTCAIDAMIIAGVFLGGGSTTVDHQHITDPIVFINLVALEFLDLWRKD